VATTREKTLALVDELKQTPAETLAPEARNLVEAVSIMQGFGVDPVDFLIPQTDAEADLFVDKAISMLLQIRGDDLPPFDPDRYGEAAEA
jgi:hypothetical protein